MHLLVRIACDAPFPMVLQRDAGSWRRPVSLSISGLPTLKALGGAARWTDAGTLELAYSTQGSGAFRGMVSW